MGFKSPEGSAYLDLFGFDMDLDISEGAVRLTPLESGSTEAVLLVEAIRCSTVGEDHHKLVNCLRVGGEKILPKGLEIEFKVLILKDELPRTCQHLSS